MPISLIIAFVALPLLELALLIKIGQAIGFWATIGIVISTAVLGTYVVRRSGFSALSWFGQMQEAISRGETLMGPVMDHVLLVASGVLLVAPGVITDVLGLMLLIPPIRAACGRRISARFDQDRDSGPESKDRTGGDVIEGEFRRLDE